MKFLLSKQLWMAIIATTLFWLSVPIFGSDRTRDIVDLGASLVAVILLYNLIPESWDRFRRGADRPEWRFIIGTTMLLLYTVEVSLWGFSIRWYDNVAPTIADAMRDNPINGFFRFQLVCANLLIMSAVADGVATVSQTKMYWLAVAFGAGILVGAAGLKMLALI